MVLKSIFHSGKTTPGVLHPALEPSMEERHALLEQGKRRATKVIRELQYLSYEQRLREEFFSLEKIRLQKDLFAALQ